MEIILTKEDQPILYEISDYAKSLNIKNQEKLSIFLQVVKFLEDQENQPT